MNNEPVCFICYDGNTKQNTLKQHHICCEHFTHYHQECLNNYYNKCDIKCIICKKSVVDRFYITPKNNYSINNIIRHIRFNRQNGWASTSHVLLNYTLVLCVSLFMFRLCRHISYYELVFAAVMTYTSVPMLSIYIRYVDLIMCILFMSHPNSMNNVIEDVERSTSVILKMSLTLNVITLFFTLFYFVSPMLENGNFLCGIMIFVNWLPLIYNTIKIFVLDPIFCIYLLDSYDYDYDSDDENRNNIYLVKED